LRCPALVNGCVFCYPGLSRDGKVPALLGTDPDALQCFGYKARVPLVSGRFDRTEVDLRPGNVLVEAKLTEGDFRSVRKSSLLAYRDLAEVFDGQQLPQTKDHYVS